MQIGRLTAGILAFTTTFTHAAGVGKQTYSIWMANSLVSRSDGIMNVSSASEPLQAGFTQKAFTALLHQYPNQTIARDHLLASVNSVLPYFSNATEDVLLYPLDRLSNGNAEISLYRLEKHSNETAALHAGFEALRLSIDISPRNLYGGLWYYVYPEWSYLDGMYSLAPFYSLYTISTADKASGGGDLNTTALDDMTYQLDLLWKHCRNSSSGLLVHGYDASMTAVWADPVTGASPIVWGRSLGWYLMSLVDTLEILSVGSAPLKYVGQLLEKFGSLAEAVIQAADPDTGAWWQVLDQPDREGNYIESSVSAMFTYALFKGARLGFLPSNETALAKNAAVKAYQYLNETFVVYETDGTLGWNGTVSVCSLNSTATYEYYVEQPLKYNSVLGSAAYILASLEYERLGTS